MSVLLMTIHGAPPSPEREQCPSRRCYHGPPFIVDHRDCTPLPRCFSESLDLTSSAILLVSMQAVRTVTEVAIFRHFPPTAFAIAASAKCCQ